MFSIWLGFALRVIGMTALLFSPYWHIAIVVITVWILIQTKYGLLNRAWGGMVVFLGGVCVQLFSVWGISTIPFPRQISLSATLFSGIVAIFLIFMSSIAKLKKYKNR